MRLRLPFVLLPVLASLVADARDARACGGCFVDSRSSTQVIGHRMILSLSQDHAVYDQISYVGDPADFAWVLPIRGEVEVGLSSDAMFALMEQATARTINSPIVDCSGGGDGFGNGGPCGGNAGNGGSSFGAGGGSAAGETENPPVEVIAEAVVGPYETVQLSATDPAALNDWLSNHGYNVPPEVQPVIDEYVADGMDFLALRLAPGKGVSSMRPVRVTTPGAGPVLPLRMVAAGTGAKTGLTLRVLSEGRYEPQNFPSFMIDSNELVWDWDASRSNYVELREAGYLATGGLGWIVEAAEPQQVDFAQLTDLAQFDPVGSGYADSSGRNASQNAAADIETITSGIRAGSMWINRMSAELPSAALNTDLTLTASARQTAIPRYFDLINAVGTEPQCTFAVGDCGDLFPNPNDSDDSLEPRGGNAGCACAVTSSAVTDLSGLLASLAAGLIAARRRRR